jgi:hypothetical protein
VGIVRGGEVARRLVQKKVDQGSGICQGLTIDDDFVAQWIYPGAQLCDDLSVDLHSPLADQFLTGAPGADAGAGHDLLQSFGVTAHR